MNEKYIWFLYLSILVFILGKVSIAGEIERAKIKVKNIYQYKKYEYFDMGNLEVKGNLLTPGDLSIKDRKIREFNNKLYQRENFKDKSLKQTTLLR